MNLVPRTLLPTGRLTRASSFALTIGLFALIHTTPARAQTWNETGDAQDLPATAQITAGNGPLTVVNGTLTGDTDKDMYCINITDPANFFAHLQCVIILGPDVYLFDGTGEGVALAQICSAGSKSIPPGFVTTAGTYYLAVAASGALPKANPGTIWLPGTTNARAPDGPGAASPIVSWGGTPVLNGPGAYTVILNGATFCTDVTAAPRNSWGVLKLIYR